MEIFSMSQFIKRNLVGQSRVLVLYFIKKILNFGNFAARDYEQNAYYYTPIINRPIRDG